MSSLGLVDDTPIEEYQVGKRSVLVKREDMSSISPGPPFSKVRGLMKALVKLKEGGKHYIGYVETSISMAGWGVAWGCEVMGLGSVIFDPQYVKTPELLKVHRVHWSRHGSVVVPIKAGMARVNWNVCRKLMLKEYGDRGELLPLGLPFEETIEATCIEYGRSIDKIGPIDNLVVNVGSGTVCAGLLRGVYHYSPGVMVYGIMGRSGEVGKKMKLISSKAGVPVGGMFGIDFKLIDPGWKYTEESRVSCPFPSHKYYDLKAWEWLCGNIDKLEGSVLFWNIGREGI